MFTDKRRYTWRQQLAFSALLMYLYRVKQYNQIYNQILKTFAFPL
jgi:hypothetical protein